MNTIETPILVIGAGPAGLATAAHLRSQGLEFEVLERSDKIAYSWHNHYDRLCLHTVKQFSELPLKKFPSDYPTYVTRQNLVDYLEDYAKEFQIAPHFNQEVKVISKEGDSWKVRTEQGKVFLAEHVVVATGVNRIPHVPVWRGQDSFKGEIVHSRSYKNPDPFQGKKVLVVGFGNTGAELALDLCKHEVDTTVSIRSPISIVPRDLRGRPVQVTAKKLAQIPFGIGDWLGSQIRKLYFGNLRKYGIPLTNVHPAVQLRETGKTPVIDLGTIREIKNGKIKVAGDIDYLDGSVVVFKDGKRENFDSILLATGYRALLSEFIKGIESFLDKNDLPKNPVGDGKFENLYFTGFDNYKIGGILGTIQTESGHIAKAIKERYGVVSSNKVG